MIDRHDIDHLRAGLRRDRRALILRAETFEFAVEPPCPVVVDFEAWNGPTERPVDAIGVGSHQPEPCQAVVRILLLSANFGEGVAGVFWLAGEGEL